MELEICHIGKNGMFEIAGTDAGLMEYFSARRAEVEAALDNTGLTSSEAPALAGAIAKASRTAKQTANSTDRFAAWCEIAEEKGYRPYRLSNRLWRSEPRLRDCRADGTDGENSRNRLDDGRGLGLEALHPDVHPKRSSRMKLIEGKVAIITARVPG